MCVSIPARPALHPSTKWLSAFVKSEVVARILDKNLLTSFLFFDFSRNKDWLWDLFKITQQSCPIIINQGFKFRAKMACHWLNQGGNWLMISWIKPKMVALEVSACPQILSSHSDILLNIRDRNYIWTFWLRVTLLPLRICQETRGDAVTGFHQQTHTHTQMAGNEHYSKLECLEWLGAESEESPPSKDKAPQTQAL